MVTNETRRLRLPEASDANNADSINRTFSGFYPTAVHCAIECNRKFWGRKQSTYTYSSTIFLGKVPVGKFTKKQTSRSFGIASAFSFPFPILRIGHPDSLNLLKLELQDLPFINYSIWW